MNIRENVPISTLTTMRLGGPADFVIEITDKEEIPEAFAFVEEKNLPVYFLGSGANSLGKDEGFNGAIIINKIMGLRILEETKDELLIEVNGGVVWDDFVAFVCEKGFSGIEAMSKIPGTVAAAPVQNIGAYGQDISQTLVSVEAYDSLLDEFLMLENQDCDFSYRHSIFNSGEKRGRYFIISATFRLTKKTLEPPFYNSLQAYLDEHGITEYAPVNIRAAVSDIRAHKLPDPVKIASAGSFFKNLLLTDVEAKHAGDLGIPVYRSEKFDDNGKLIKAENKVNTGWLLEHAGLKGQTFHGFKVSDKAALILINESAKSYADLEKAIAEIQAIIKEKYGFLIEPEPVKIEAD